MTDISTHTLRKEGDIKEDAPCYLLCLFQPTPSARRVTGRSIDDKPLHVISTHTLRKEGDSMISPTVCGTVISTHTLRKEGDARDGEQYVHTSTFQPTPSARRVTFSPFDIILVFCISNHTLRKEGDIHTLFDIFWFGQFQPTPSARRVTRIERNCRSLKLISTHTLRKEGDTP